jgi:hypothetical protein
MSDRGLVVIRVGVIYELFRRDVTELGEEVLQILGPAVEFRNARVDLDPVTRGENGPFEDVLVGPKLVKRFGELLLGDAETFKKLYGSCAVVDSNDDYWHRRRN